MQKSESVFLYNNNGGFYGTNVELLYEIQRNWTVETCTTCQGNWLNPLRQIVGFHLYRGIFVTKSYTFRIPIASCWVLVFQGNFC